MTCVPAFVGAKNCKGSNFWADILNSKRFSEPHFSITLPSREPRFCAVMKGYSPSRGMNLDEGPVNPSSSPNFIESCMLFEFCKSFSHPIPGKVGAWD